MTGQYFSLMDEMESFVLNHDVPETLHVNSELGI